MTAGLRYAYRDPRTDFEPLPTWGTEPLDSRVRGWPHPLKTFRIGQHRVSDARILPIGIATDEAWLCDCLQYLPPHWPDAAWMQRIGGHRLVDDDDGLRLEPDQASDPVVLQGSWCVLNDLVGCRNIAHFFRDELPQLIAIRDLLQADPGLKVLTRASEIANINMLRELVIPRSRIATRPYPTEQMGDAPLLQPQTLVLQPLAFNGGQGFYPSFQAYDFWLALDEYRRGLSLLREALDQRCGGGPELRDTWICFSRNLHRATEAQQGRHYTNYPDLLERLSNNGVIVLDPGHFSILQLHSLLHSARGFVGIHGAALANALLGPQGARVVEIRSHSGVSCNLELLGKAAGLDWRCIDTPQAEDGSARGVIPIELILALIHERG